MNGLPVTIRTVDIGADKPLDRMSANELRHEHALNPALGLRAIRWSLSEPAMFRQQLRAILRAERARQGAAADADGRAPERGAADARGARAGAAAARRCRPARYGPVEIGAMIEVPAAALMLPAFLRHFDFVSIGTNDLIQYTLAIDRADEAVAHLYDPWHPAVLQLIAQTIAQRARRRQGRQRLRRDGRRHRPSRELLLAMGLRSFSMHPSQIVVDQAAHPRDRCGRAGAPSLPRILAADDPERECVAAAGLIAQERASAPRRRSGPLGSGLRNCAIVAPLVLLQSGASGLRAHRGLGEN